MKALFVFSFLLLQTLAYSQVIHLPDISKNELLTQTFAIDTTANAVILLERGSTMIQKSDADMALMVFHRYGARTKIVNQEGYKHADYRIPLYTYGSTSEYIIDIKARTYNLAPDGSISTTSLKIKDIFTEKVSEYLKVTKFTLPDIRPASVIDVEYTVVSPDIFKFRTWAFQADIPKISSEYNAVIPAMFKYNVTLRGTLKVKDTKSKIYRECLNFNGAKMDCSDITYIMEDIPAFIEEEYMLAPKNYLSAIHFELEESTDPRGAVKKYTQEWADVDRELMSDKSFGGQLKEANFFKKVFPSEILSITDPYKKASEIYHFIQKHIRWNKYYGKYSQNGVKNSFENRSGNIADINLALTVALQAGGLEAYPVLVSTRDNIVPNTLYPVISEFNYLVCGVKIDGKILLADASEPLLSFGELPLRAINDRGRIIYSRKSSEWIPLVNPLPAETSYSFSGEYLKSGKIVGQLTVTSLGYDAFQKRQSILKYASKEEYEEKLDERLTNIRIKKLDLSNVEDNTFPLIETSEIEITVGDSITSESFTINPIFVNRTTRNPFNLDDRTYPVDIGSRKAENHHISIRFPEDINLKSAPKSISLVLPDKAAQYIYKSSFENHVLTVDQQLALNKAIYNTDEYFHLKELFSRIIQQLKVDHLFTYTP